MGGIMECTGENFSKKAKYRVSSALYIVHVIHDNDDHVSRVQYIEHWTPGYN